MGQSSSFLHEEDCDGKSECDTTTPSSISFDPSQSYMVSYGVDVQTNPKFTANMSLSSIAVRDATKIRDVLVQTGIIPASNAHLYTASTDLESCKISGIKRSYQVCQKSRSKWSVCVPLLWSRSQAQNPHEKSVVTGPSRLQLATSRILPSQRMCSESGSKKQSARLSTFCFSSIAVMLVALQRSSLDSPACQSKGIYSCSLPALLMRRL